MKKRVLIALPPCSERLRKLAERIAVSVYKFLPDCDIFILDSNASRKNDTSIFEVHAVIEKFLLNSIVKFFKIYRPNLRSREIPSISALPDTIFIDSNDVKNHDFFIFINLDISENSNSFSNITYKFDVFEKNFRKKTINSALLNTPLEAIIRLSGKGISKRLPIIAKSNPLELGRSINEFEAEIVNTLPHFISKFIRDEKYMLSELQEYGQKEIRYNYINALYRHISTAVAELIKNLFWRKYWGILISKVGEDTFYYFRESGTSTWADPFIYTYNDKNYLFFEEVVLGGKGRICVSEISSEGIPINKKVLLDDGFHMSFPQVFKIESEIYMTVESESKRSVDLYKSVKFPCEWTKVKTLLSDICFADPVLFEYNGMWYLIGSIRTGQDSSSMSTLFMYSAKNPLRDTFSPSSDNPIKCDVTNARNGGRIYFSNKLGKLVRISQNCASKYADGIVFNTIDSLSQNKYRETKAVSYSFKNIEHIDTLHTYSANEAFVAVDAQLWCKRRDINSSKYFGIPLRVKTKIVEV